MKKILQIGWKDLRVIFRDRAALILMLLAPFFLALGLGLVTGQLGNPNGGLSTVPVIVVNQDDGRLGQELVDLLTTPEMQDLLDASQMDNSQAARLKVDEDEVSAVVIIPPGFTHSILPEGEAIGSEVVQIEVYQNPSRSIGAGIVTSIVESFIAEVETGRIGGQVAAGMLVASGRIPREQAAQAGMQIGQQLAGDPESLRYVRLTASDVEQEAVPSLLMYVVPGFALLFLMYTVSLGGRTLLLERQGGTLTRLLATPTGASTVLVGKMTGTYFIGVAQMSILIVAGVRLMGLRWGAPLALALLILTAVAGATGWGMLLASLARTPAQVQALGLAMTLLFGLVGGSFFGSLPSGLMGILGMITPNYWGQKGFIILADGGGVQDLLPVYAALLAMGAVLLVISTLVFRKKGMLQR